MRDSGRWDFRTILSTRSRTRPILCPDCAKPYQPEPALLRRFAAGRADGQYRRGSGCPKCLNSGSRGRVGIYEFLDLNQDIQLGIEQSLSTNALRLLAVQKGMKQMWQDGLDKARLGTTTLEEVAGVATVYDIDDAAPHAGAQEQVRLSA